MQITLNTADAGPDEYTALIALLASLGGRLPAGGTHVFVVTDESTPKPPVSSVTAGNDGLTVTNGADTPAASNDGTTTSNAPAASDVDSKGTPWDARIHSESKATVADGTWRKRRGVDDATFTAVMAELTDGQDEAPPPPPADEPEGNEEVPAPPAPTEDKPSEPEPAANAPAAGDPPSPAGGGQFPDFASFVGAVSKHSIPYAELNERAATLGVPMFKDLKDHADKWDLFFSMIG